jgi:hypothetical protein
VILWTVCMLMTYVLKQGSGVKKNGQSIKSNRGFLSP